MSCDDDDVPAAISKLNNLAGCMALIHCKFVIAFLQRIGEHKLSYLLTYILTYWLLGSLVSHITNKLIDDQYRTTPSFMPLTDAQEPCTRNSGNSCCTKTCTSDMLSCARLILYSFFAPSRTQLNSAQVCTKTYMNLQKCASFLK